MFDIFNLETMTIDVVQNLVMDIKKDPGTIQEFIIYKIL